MAAQTALWWDDLWVVDSTPVPCGASRETVLRSDPAGWAQYGYCASHYFGREFEAGLTDRDIVLIRPARKGEAPRAGRRFLKPWRQCIESINQTLKGQLDLERHAGRTVAGVTARIAARLLALTTAIWHNEQIGSADQAVTDRL
ncbi:hypothetical protein [Nonomuraea sp. NPDC049784]|uniref:hypothetical protein n=1 Tax=Nonomuraea sp. NPDC049784 TaxID=3154361 RepID=UPI0033D57717